MGLFKNSIEDRIEKIENAVNGILGFLKLEKYEDGVKMSQKNMINSYFADKEGNQVCRVTAATDYDYPIEAKVCFHSVVKFNDQYTIHSTYKSPEMFCKMFPRLTTKKEYEEMLEKAFEYLKE